MGLPRSLPVSALRRWWRRNSPCLSSPSSLGHVQTRSHGALMGDRRHKSMGWSWHGMRCAGKRRGLIRQQEVDKMQNWATASWNQVWLGGSAVADEQWGLLQPPFCCCFLAQTDVVETVLLPHPASTGVGTDTDRAQRRERQIARNDTGVDLRMEGVGWSRFPREKWNQ